jgi:hypothetical protein
LGLILPAGRAPLEAAQSALPIALPVTHSASTLPAVWFVAEEAHWIVSMKVAELSASPPESKIPLESLRGKLERTGCACSQKILSRQFFRNTVRR